MLSKISVGAVAFGFLSLGSVRFDAPAVAQTPTPTFFCAKSPQGVPTTYVRRASDKPDPLIRWQRDWGGEYTPERRCEIVSQNFQEALEQELNFYTYARINSQNVICAAQEDGGDCVRSLFTLRAEDDPAQVMNSLMEGGYVSSGFITQSQGSSQQRYYDIRLFLSDPPRPTEKPAVL